MVNVYRLSLPVLTMAPRSLKCKCLTRTDGKVSIIDIIADITIDGTYISKNITIVKQLNSNLILFIIIFST